MRLDRVTITGADDSIEPHKLCYLTSRFPFVEWGILVSKSSEGSPRFPRREWIAELFNHIPKDRLSLHICGRWTRQLLLGVNEFPEEWKSKFSRMQLNFHAENTKCDAVLLHSALNAMRGIQYVFQIDGSSGNKHLEDLYYENGENENGAVDAVPLFDVSGGAGIVPKKWPKPEYLDDADYCYHGYAGGLGPDNLEKEIKRIEAVAEDARIWIDMETKVRSANDLLFDLTKAQFCLEVASVFVKR